MWLALTEMAIPPGDILASFPPYRPDGYTAALALANLAAKVDDEAFRSDLRPLVASWPAEYNVDSAADLICRELLAHI